jgi:hypothetical protein
VFSPEEALAFLLARSGSGDEGAAGVVAELLGWLPLALEQAGAYTREARIGLGDYLARLQEFPALTLAKGAPRDRDPTDMVATTWQVSLDQVGSIPGATGLLELSAFLAPDDIPRALLSQLTNLEELPEELSVLGGDPFAFDDAVAGLRSFGLVKASEHTLVVHRVLQHRHPRRVRVGDRTPGAPRRLPGARGPVAPEPRLRRPGRRGRAAPGTVRALAALGGVRGTRPALSRSLGAARALR